MVPLGHSLQCAGVGDVTVTACEELLANDVDVCFEKPGTSEMCCRRARPQPQMGCVLGLIRGAPSGGTAMVGRDLNGARATKA